MEDLSKKHPGFATFLVDQDSFRSKKSASEEQETAAQEEKAEEEQETAAKEEKAARVFIAFDVRFSRFSLRKRKKSAKWSGRMSKNLEYLLHSSSVCVSRSESLVGYLGYEPCVL